LAFLSFLMLFTELVLIRWTAANNIHLAYLTNFVLLASFLGIGIGFLSANSKRNLSDFAPVALVALVAFMLVFPVSYVKLSGPHQLQGRFGLTPLPQGLSLPVIFLLSVAVMAGIGQGVGRAFTRFRPLEAYRLDILGSIGGIVLFSALAFWELPPVAWGLIVGIGFVVLLGRRMRWWQWGATIAMVALLGTQSFRSHEYWSPYYKVTTAHVPGVPRALSVSANNIPHQTVYPISVLRRIEPFYFYPYRHVNRHSLNDVLIVGAGTGNDVAVALSEGARHIDAVEIDPVLQSLGSRYNPNHPYQNPRVSAHINDGRAYLQQSDTHYDLILFALPDSLTVLGGQSNLRLENYLFTLEAMRSARAHLKPGGTFAMYNYYEPFLLNRYASTLQAAYGSRPCVELNNSFSGGRRQAVLTIGAGGTTRRCATPWHGKMLAPATDDHPFPYLASNSIPSFYLVVLGLILVAALLIVRMVGAPFRGMARYLDLAFMGAAFLLLETKNVVQFALLFGTTWFVNSLVFAGVLLAVLAAVEVARHVRLPRPLVLYVALLVSLAVAWVVPQENLLNLPTEARMVVASAIAFAPIFFANLVFAQRFADVASSTTAFATNLLGAMIGGVLEYLALISGYRFLLIVVAVLYGFAFLFGRRHLGVASGSGL
jgi:hypothetical protein